jgi:hypothetical protein
MSSIYLIGSLPIDVLKMIEKFLVKYDPTVHTWKHLASTGNINGLKFLHEHNVSECTPFVLDIAAINNHFNCVRFLYDNIIESHSEDVLSWAVKDLSMVQWLYERCSEYCTTDVMDCAAQYGNLDVLVWLHEQGEHCTRDALRYASLNEHYDVVQWLCTFRTEGCTVCVQNVCKRRLPTMVDYLHSFNGPYCTYHQRH